MQSKISTVGNILLDLDVDICILTETQTAKDKNIPIPNYTCYFRNRILREKGGVAVYVNDRIANGCLKMESGLENNEFLILKFENFEPNLVVIGYYGVIEGQYPKEQVTAMQSDIFNLFRKYKEEGCQIYWCGDFNNHVPNELGIVGNNIEKPSQGGLNLVEFVREENLEIVNKRDCFHTHVDKSEGVSRILDFVVTNRGDLVSDFEVDKSCSFTPYRIIRDKMGHKRRYTDHLGLKWKVMVKRKESETNKMVMWNFNKVNGNYKYEEFTNNRADDINTLISEEDDIEVIHEYILNVVEEAKKYAYGKITRTKSQLKRLSDGQIWKKRTKDIEKAILNVGKVRTNDKIWEMRSRTTDKYGDKQFVGVKRPGTEVMTGSREETFEVVLQYNHDLLRKDDEEKESEENKRMRELKEFAVKHALDHEGFEEDEEFELEDFKAVVEKIRINNKNVYRDFTMAGGKFKLAILNFYNKIYRIERMPGSFNDTDLLKLYKGKGNRAELKFNRFLHLKPWLPKGYEKMVMTKMEKKMFKNTPEYQVGGQKLGSTNEHLVSMITTMRRLEITQGGGYVVFMDIKACFDRIRLNDILFEAAQAGVVGKPLRCIKEYTEGLNIRIRGDPNPDRVRKITNSTGQGSGFAPVGTSMVMAKTLENRIEERSEEEKKLIISEVSGVKLKPNFFVDDLAKNCGKVKEVKIMGEVISDTLNELRLDAHPEKSGVLMYGAEIDKFKKELEDDPAYVQGFKLNVKESETYLGMVFTKGGASDSIYKTLEIRRGKCLAKAADIKRKLDDERMEGVGWLAGVILLYNSIIVSTLTYGAAAFTGLEKRHWDLLESIQRQCLIHILGISNKTTHQSLLYVLGISPVKDVVKKLQVSFMNNLVHIKGSGQCLETLKDDYKLGDVKGLIGEVKEHCKEFGLDDVMETYIHPQVIKKKIERVVLDRQWIRDLKAKKPPLSIRRDDRKQRFYTTLPKNKAKLMLCYELGDLNFRKSRKSEALKKFGSYECLVPHCREEDSLEHVRTCDGYSSRLKDSAGPYELIDYLAELELERNKRFRKSLINFKTL